MANEQPKPTKPTEPVAGPKSPAKPPNPILLNPTDAIHAAHDPVGHRVPPDVVNRSHSPKQDER